MSYRCRVGIHANVVGIRRADRLSRRPGPLIKLWHIHAMLVSVVLTLDLHIAEYFFGVSARHLKCGHTVDNVDRQTETIDLVLDGQIERRIDVSFFLVTTHVQVLVVGTSIG